MNHKNKITMQSSRRSVSVAVIGPDGAGKSTVVKGLHKSGRFYSEIVYMGGNAASANHTLPTTRWLTNRWLAQTGHDGRIFPAAKPDTATESAYKKRTPLHMRMLRGLKSAARLTHELLEYTYRFLVAWVAQKRGAVVLFDRYIYDPLIDAMADSPSQWAWYRALLFKKIFPRPDLLIVLEAPGTLLFERKGEHDPERLERVRDACRLIASEFRWVEFIDATRPADEVLEQALAFITMHATQEQRFERRLSRVG